MSEAPIWLIVICVLVVAAAAAAVLMRRRLIGGGDAEVAGAVGPTRCLAAMARFSALAKAGDSAAIAEAVEALEMPLLQALPDCPPSLKPALAEALTQAAEACKDRSAAKRLMALRNALVG